MKFNLVHSLWTRSTAVLVCGLAGLVLSLAGYVCAVVGWDRPNAARQLQLLGENRALMLQETLRDFEQMLDASVDPFTAPAASVDRDSFRRNVEQLRRNFGLSVTLAWAPRVWRAARAAHESAAARAGLARYRIRDIDLDGDAVMAGERDEYLPLLYVDGDAATAPGAGVDLAGSVPVHDAIERALQSGGRALSSTFRYPSAAGMQAANLLVQPVYDVGLPVKTAAQRRAALAGVVVGFAQPGALLSRTLKAVKSPQGLDIYLYEDNEAHDLPLFVRTSLLSSQPAPLLTRTQAEAALHWSGQVQLGDTRWAAVVVPIADAPFLGASNRAWLVLVIGLVLTGVVTLYVAFVDRVLRDLHVTRDGLALSHVVMNAAMEASPDGILIVDGKLRPLSYSRRFAAMFDLPARADEAPPDATLLDLVATRLQRPHELRARAGLAGDRGRDPMRDDLELVDGRTFVRRSAPLVSRDQAFLGRIWFFGDVTEERRAQRRLLDLVCVDSLTGLANRRTFTERLAQQYALTKRNGHGFAVLFLDLDRFKEVNDTLGHAAGDRVLKEVAKRLRSTLRETDVVARLGGDEFAVLLPGAGDAASAALVAAGICARLAAPYAVEGCVARVTASVGVCLHSCTSCTPDELLAHADQALYAAKRQGRNRYCIFDPSHELDEQDGGGAPPPAAPRRRAPASRAPGAALTA